MQTKYNICIYTTMYQDYFSIVQKQEFFIKNLQILTKYLQKLYIYDQLVWYKLTQLVHLWWFTILQFYFSNEFAYSSSDGMVYIRKFSLEGPKMTLQNTLQGHEGEITCIRWNPYGKGFWVTGSDDATIRIWVSEIFQENFCIW